MADLLLHDRLRYAPTQSDDVSYTRVQDVVTSTSDNVLSEGNPAGDNTNEQQHNPESVVAKDRHFFASGKS